MKVKFLRSVNIITDRVHFKYAAGEVVEFGAQRAAHHVANGNCEYVFDKPAVVDDFPWCVPVPYVAPVVEVAPVVDPFAAAVVAPSPVRGRGRGRRS